MAPSIRRESPLNAITKPSASVPNGEYWHCDSIANPGRAFPIKTNYSCTISRLHNICQHIRRSWRLQRDRRKECLGRSERPCILAADLCPNLSNKDAARQLMKIVQTRPRCFKRESYNLAQIPK